MASNEYMNDTDCFKSYANLRENLYYRRKLPTKTVAATSKVYQVAKPKKPTISLTDYKNDKSVIIAIQNDVRFINIIMNFKKKSSLIAHIFVESNLYISCVIKNADSYPLVFIRIPIDDVYTYANNTNNAYEFPLQNLLKKDIKYTKNNSYTMLFKYDGQNVNFIYELYNGEPEPNRVIINAIATNNQSVVNNIFKNDNFNMLSNSQVQFATPIVQPETDDYLLSFFNMNVIILKEVVNNNNKGPFELKQLNKAKNYIEISNGQMMFVSEVSNNVNEIFLCSSQGSGTLIWPVVDINAKYTISSYDPLFRTNYNKSISTNDKTYYLFTSYLNDYMFIKMTTPYSVPAEDKSANNFIKIFSKDYQFLECYLCSKC